jgi:hypothetical protein
LIVIANIYEVLEVHALQAQVGLDERSIDSCLERLEVWLRGLFQHTRGLRGWQSSDQGV